MSTFKLASSAALLLSVASVQAASPCNLDVAMAESAFRETYADELPSVAPATGTDLPVNPWTDYIIDPVLPTFKAKRADGFQCAEGDICVDGGSSLTPYCIYPGSGYWYNLLGYSGSQSTNDYSTPDGEEGNLVTGPCPGSFYEESSMNGYACARVSNSVPPEGPTLREDVSGTPTPTGSGTPSQNSEVRITESPSLTASGGAIAANSQSTSSTSSGAAPFPSAWPAPGLAGMAAVLAVLL